MVSNKLISLQHVTVAPESTSWALLLVCFLVRPRVFLLETWKLNPSVVCTADGSCTFRSGSFGACIEQGMQLSQQVHSGSKAPRKAQRYQGHVPSFREGICCGHQMSYDQWLVGSITNMSNDKFWEIVSDKKGTPDRANRAHNNTRAAPHNTAARQHHASR